MKPLKLSSLALAVGCVSAAAYAQTTTVETAQINADYTGSALMPDPIIQTYVIDSEVIRSYPSASVFDLLKQAPMVQYKQNGGPGTLSSVGLRGMRAEATLVLIDGVRYGSVSSAQAQLALIPAQSLDRVEIYYGAAAAARFGADGAGGVIQLFTKRSAQKTASVSAFGGTSSQVGGSVFGSAPIQGGFVSAQAGVQRLGDFSAVKDPNNFAYEADTDVYNARFASVSLQKRIGNTQLKLSGLINDSVSEFDAGDPAGNTEQEQLNGGANLELTHQFGSTLVSASHGVSVDYSEVATPFVYKYNTTQQQSKLYLHQALAGGGLASLGAEYLSQKLDTDGALAEDYRRTSSLVAGVSKESGVLDLSATARMDKVEGGTSQGNGSLAAAYYVTPAVKVGAQLGRAFRLPNFNDLYSPFGANPDLLPETTVSKEVFAEANLAGVSSRVTLHQTDVDNYILLDSSFIPQNLDQVELQGVSVTSQANAGPVGVFVSYDYLEATNESGLVVPYVPKHQATLALSAPVTPALDARLEGSFNSSRASRLGTLRDLPSYSLLNAAVLARASDQLSGSLRVNNLLDKDYESAKGYATAGVEAVASVTWSF